MFCLTRKLQSLNFSLGEIQEYVLMSNQAGSTDASKQQQPFLHEPSNQGPKGGGSFQGSFGAFLLYSFYISGTM